MNEFFENEYDTNKYDALDYMADTMSLTTDFSKNKNLLELFMDSPLNHLLKADDKAFERFRKYSSTYMDGFSAYNSNSDKYQIYRLNAKDPEKLMAVRKALDDAKIKYYIDSKGGICIQKYPTKDIVFGMFFKPVRSEKAHREVIDDILHDVFVEPGQSTDGPNKKTTKSPTFSPTTEACNNKGKAYEYFDEPNDERRASKDHEKKEDPFNEKSDIEKLGGRKISITIDEKTKDITFCVAPENKDLFEKAFGTLDNHEVYKSNSIYKASCSLYNLNTVSEFKNNKALFEKVFDTREKKELFNDIDKELKDYARHQQASRVICVKDELKIKPNDRDNLLKYEQALTEMGFDCKRESVRPNSGLSHLDKKDYVLSIDFKKPENLKALNNLVKDNNINTKDIVMQFNLYFSKNKLDQSFINDNKEAYKEFKKNHDEKEKNLEEIAKERGFDKEDIEKLKSNYKEFSSANEEAFEKSNAWTERLIDKADEYAKFELANANKEEIDEELEDDELELFPGEEISSEEEKEEEEKESTEEGLEEEELEPEFEEPEAEEKKKEQQNQNQDNSQYYDAYQKAYDDQQIYYNQQAYNDQQDYYNQQSYDNQQDYYNNESYQTQQAYDEYNNQYNNESYQQSEIQAQQETVYNEQTQSYDAQNQVAESYTAPQDYASQSSMDNTPYERPNNDWNRSAWNNESHSDWFSGDRDTAFNSNASDSFYNNQRSYVDNTLNDGYNWGQTTSGYASEPGTVNIPAYEANSYVEQAVAYANAHGQNFEDNIRYSEYIEPSREFNPEKVAVFATGSQIPNNYDGCNYGSNLPQNANVEAERAERRQQQEQYNTQSSFVQNEAYSGSNESRSHNSFETFDERKEDNSSKGSFSLNKDNPEFSLTSETTESNKWLFDLSDRGNAKDNYERDQENLQKVERAAGKMASAITDQEFGRAILGDNASQAAGAMINATVGSIFGKTASDFERKRVKESFDSGYNNRLMRESLSQRHGELNAQMQANDKEMSKADEIIARKNKEIENFDYGKVRKEAAHQIEKAQTNIDIARSRNNAAQHLSDEERRYITKESAESIRKNKEIINENRSIFNNPNSAKIKLEEERNNAEQGRRELYRERADIRDKVDASYLETARESVRYSIISQGASNFSRMADKEFKEKLKASGFKQEQIKDIQEKMDEKLSALQKLDPKKRAEATEKLLKSGNLSEDEKEYVKKKAALMDFKDSKKTNPFKKYGDKFANGVGTTVKKSVNALAKNSGEAGESILYIQQSYSRVRKAVKGAISHHKKQKDRINRLFGINKKNSGLKKKISEFGHARLDDFKKTKLGQTISDHRQKKRDKKAEKDAEKQAKNLRKQTKKQDKKDAKKEKKDAKKAKKEEKKRAKETPKQKEKREKKEAKKAKKEEKKQARAKKKEEWGEKLKGAKTFVGKVKLVIEIVKAVFEDPVYTVVGLYIGIFIFCITTQAIINAATEGFSAILAAFEYMQSYEEVTKVENVFSDTPFGATAAALMLQEDSNYRSPAWLKMTCETVDGIGDSIPWFNPIGKKIADAIEEAIVEKNGASRDFYYYYTGSTIAVPLDKNILLTSGEKDKTLMEIDPIVFTPTNNTTFKYTARSNLFGGAAYTGEITDTEHKKFIEGENGQILLALGYKEGEAFYDYGYHQIYKMNIAESLLADEYSSVMYLDEQGRQIGRFSNVKQILSMTAMVFEETKDTVTMTEDELGEAIESGKVDVEMIDVEGEGSEELEKMSVFGFLAEGSQIIRTYLEKLGHNVQSMTVQLLEDNLNIDIPEATMGGQSELTNYEKKYAMAAYNASHHLFVGYAATPSEKVDLGLCGIQAQKDDPSLSSSLPACKYLRFKVSSADEAKIEGDSYGRIKDYFVETSSLGSKDKAAKALNNQYIEEFEYTHSEEYIKANKCHYKPLEVTTKNITDRKKNIIKYLQEEKSRTDESLIRVEDDALCFGDGNYYYIDYSGLITGYSFIGEYDGKPYKEIRVYCDFVSFVENNKNNSSGKIYTLFYSYIEYSIAEGLANTVFDYNNEAIREMSMCSGHPRLIIALQINTFGLDGTVVDDGTFDDLGNNDNGKNTVIMNDSSKSGFETLFDVVDKSPQCEFLEKSFAKAGSFVDGYWTEAVSGITAIDPVTERKVRVDIEYFFSKYMTMDEEVQTWTKTNREKARILYDKDWEFEFGFPLGNVAFLNKIMLTRAQKNEFLSLYMKTYANAEYDEHGVLVYDTKEDGTLNEYYHCFLDGNRYAVIYNALNYVGQIPYLKNPIKDKWIVEDKTQPEEFRFAAIENAGGGTAIPDSLDSSTFMIWLYATTGQNIIGNTSLEYASWDKILSENPSVGMSALCPGDILRDKRYDRGGVFLCYANESKSEAYIIEEVAQGYDNVNSTGNDLKDGVVKAVSPDDTLEQGEKVGCVSLSKITLDGNWVARSPKCFGGKTYNLGCKESSATKTDVQTTDEMIKEENDAKKDKDVFHMEDIKLTPEELEEK